MRCKRYFHFETLHACDERTDRHRARAATHSTKASYAISAGNLCVTSYLSDLSICLVCVRHSSTSFTRWRHVLLAISVIPGSCHSWPALLAIYILWSPQRSYTDTDGHSSEGQVGSSSASLRLKKN